MKKERATTSDEQRERALIAEQIERAAAVEERTRSTSPSPPAEEGLKRDESSDKVVLSLSMKPAATLAPAPVKLNALKTNPLKAAPAKKMNVFKAAEKAQSSNGSRGEKRAAPMSAAEALIQEEQERKRRRLEREAYSATA
jgi:DNA/RNA-binding protein KIN17